MNPLGKYAKIIAATVGILILVYGISLAYGKANQYWKMLKAQIISEQKEIQKGLETEIKVITAQKKSAEERMDKLKAERDLIKKRYVALQGEKDELAKKLSAIVIPSSPDELVDRLHRAGLLSAHTRPK